MIHTHLKTLKEKGFNESQAEAIIQVVTQMREIDMASAATKADLRELELRLKLHLGSMIVALGGVLIAIKYLG